MDIVLFFGLFFTALFLSYFYFARAVVYMGVLAAIIFIFLGVIMAATGYIDQTYCFSGIENATNIDNITSYDYIVTCHTNQLTLDRNFINAVGAILMFMGAGMVADFLFAIRKTGEK